MDSVLVHLRTRWQALGKWQEPVVFLGILAWWILSQWHYRWVPAYHDSLWQYYPATWIAEHRMWPFVASSDTGHPPLIAWCVGLLIFIGIPRLIAFHLYSWMIAAILAYAVWKTVRHYAGAVAGFAAAAVVVSLPLVVAQALQLTCDLSVAAFGTMMCAYLATGKYWRAGIAGSLLALSKLPGIVSVSPVAGVLFLLLLLGKRKFNSPFTRGMAMAIILTFAVFVTFTIIKYLAVGYFFENGAFMEGKQMTLVTSLSAFGKRFASTLYTLTFRTGFLPLCAVLLASVAAYFASTHPPLPTADRGGGGLSVGELMAVLLLQIVVQITTWSLRDYVTLQRYFTICLPPLIVASAIFGALAFGKRHAKFTLPAAAALAFYFSLFWKPSNFEGLPAEVRNELIAQPAHLNRNFETNLGFVEIMRNLRSAAQKVDRWARPDSVIAVPPWFEGYIAGSQHGLVGTERKIVTSSAPEWAHYREADYLIAYDVNGGKFPDNGPEGTDGDLELIQSKRGVTGTFAVYVNRSRNPRRADR